jgi:hypothetical protein
LVRIVLAGLFLLPAQVLRAEGAEIRIETPGRFSGVILD